MSHYVRARIVMIVVVFDFYLIFHRWLLANKLLYTIQATVAVDPVLGKKSNNLCWICWTQTVDCCFISSLYAYIQICHLLRYCIPLEKRNEDARCRVVELGHILNYRKKETNSSNFELSMVFIVTTLQPKHSHIS